MQSKYTLQQCWTTISQSLPIAWGNSVAKSELETRGVVQQLYVIPMFAGAQKIVY